MSTPSSAIKGPSALDFKSATLYTIRVVLHSADIAQLTAALDQRMKDAGAFFENEPVVIDASAISGDIDWPALMDQLRAHQLHPVGVVAEGTTLSAAQAAGLVSVELAQPVSRPTPAPVAEKDMPVVAPKAAPPAQPAEPAGNQPSAPPASASSNSARAEPPPAPAPTVPEVAPAAMVVNRPLRSGQRIYARNTDLIVIGVVSQGAEIIADGNIHVYGPLRGKAMAGARGDTTARIFTTQLDPELLAIAGVYRVIETPLEPELRHQPTYVHLEGDTLKITALGR